MTPWDIEENYEKGLGSVMLIKGVSAYQAWHGSTLLK